MGRTRTLSKSKFARFNHTLRALKVGLVCTGSPRTGKQIRHIGHILRSQLMGTLECRGVSDVRRNGGFLGAFVVSFGGRFTGAPASGRGTRIGLAPSRLIDVRSLFAVRAAEGVDGDLAVDCGGSLFVVGRRGRPEELVNRAIRVGRCTSNAVGLCRRGELLRCGMVGGCSFRRHILNIQRVRTFLDRRLAGSSVREGGVSDFMLRKGVSDKRFWVTGERSVSALPWRLSGLV